MKKHVLLANLANKAPSNHRRISKGAKIVKISSILQVLYLPAGLFAYRTIEPYSSPYLAILYLLFVYNVIGVAAVIGDEHAQPLENLYFMSSGSIVLVSLLIARYHKDYLWHLYSQVIECQRSAEFNRLSHAVIRSKLKYAIVAIAVPLIFIAVVPLYTTVCTDAKTDELVVLLYPMWYPWRRDTLLKHLCSMFLQYVSVLYGYYLMSFLIGSLMFASLFIRVRFILLERRISRMDKHDESHADGGKSASLETVLMRNFTKIVREHQILISFTQRTIRCFTLIATILVTYATMTAAFLITLFLKNEITTLLKVKLFSTSLVGMISLVVCCFCGDLLMRLNQELTNSIYNTPWYTFPVKLRKCMITLMIQNQREFQMKSFGMSLLCKPYIGTVCKLLYSCIQFLRQRSS